MARAYQKVIVISRRKNTKRSNDENTKRVRKVARRKRKTL